MIGAEHCLRTVSRHETILKAWGLPQSERLRNFLCCTFTVWVGGGLGKVCTNRGRDGQWNLLTNLPDDVLGRRLRLPIWD